MRDGLLRRTRAYSYKGPVAASLAAALMAVVACQERAPTALDDAQLPEGPVTVEIELPWSDFGSNFQVLGGYGSVASLGSPLLAHTYAGALESRVLMRFGAYPISAQVINANGTTEIDTDIRYISGRLVLTIDTAASSNTGPVTLQLGALEEVWDANTASWTYAVDTVADQRAWTEPGAGPSTQISTAVWDPATGDSVNFVLDSAATARWVDNADQSRGGRIEADTDGVRLMLTGARLRVIMRPSIRPDTLVEDSVRLIEGTAVYDPPPSMPVGLRVGGAPAWRSIMEITVPQFTGPPELCAAVLGGCPFTAEAGHISYAALALTSRATEAVFQPTDTVRLDVRAVLSPPTLPKSPLGLSETGGLGMSISPEVFGALEGSVVEVPITAFVRTLLAGPGAGGVAEVDPPSTLALTSVTEPFSLSFASFFGPAEPGEPVLKLILTVGTPQVLP